MKKVFVLVMVVGFGIALMSSCKSTSDCPAYSQADTVEVEQQA